MKRLINKLSKKQKTFYLLLLTIVVFSLAIVIPTFSRYENRLGLLTTPIWDGSIATSYYKGTGTINDPYIISDGEELAYFSSQLTTYDYQGEYFVLTDNIKLNEGTFSYDVVLGIEYILDSVTYYVDITTNKYYDNSSYEGTEIGTLNEIVSLDGFKGSFDGGFHTIYGVYIVDETSEEVALFTDLNGDITDLYVENSIVYGGIITGGIASTSTNNVLTNVSYSGNVIGKNTLANEDINYNPTISPIIISTTETTEYIDLTNNISFVGSEIISTSITGTYIVEGDSGLGETITINGVEVTGGTFEVDLGTTILDQVPVVITVNPNKTGTLTISNLSYNITYKYGIAGGVIAKSNNTTLNKIINKADVYGYSVSGGLVGLTTDSLDIIYSYNTGLIGSDNVAGGLIGVVEKSLNNVTINTSYNSGEIVATNYGSLIGYIKANTGSVSITDVFDTSTTNYCIDTIETTSVNVTNSYYTTGSSINSGSITGTFTSEIESNLHSKTYLMTNLNFDEFIDYADLETNTSNVWIFETDSEPIIYMDDFLNPLAIITAGDYSWNNLSFELSPVKYDSLSFTLTDADGSNPMKEKYYYISNSKVPLTQTEIAAISTWTTYSTSVDITEDGFYVIYAKIVDQNDNVTYINSDLILLGLDEFLITISLEENEWTTFNDTLDNVYIDRISDLTITENTTSINVTDKKFYVTDTSLTIAELEDISYSSWINYTEAISVDVLGIYVLYVRVEDEYDFITYYNTDYIIYDGYTESDIIIGRDSLSYDETYNYITSKSTATFNFSYTKTDAVELTSHTHNLISNILIPENTQITLIDNITNKVYKYITTSADFGYSTNGYATYPFTLFNEVGKVSTNYIENTYYDGGTISEDFTIILDLKNNVDQTNYNETKLYLELHNGSNENVRPTLYSNIKDINILALIDIASSAANLSLSTTYGGSPIIYNSDSLVSVNLTSGIDYKTIGEIEVLDTTYEEKEIGLAIKLEDSEGTIVSKENLNNIIFKIDSVEYFPESDNIVHIPLENGLIETIKNLDITTFENNHDLEEGTYYLKINNYAAYDGKYYDNLGNDEISIPIEVDYNTFKIEYNFDVLLDDSDRVIEKENEIQEVSFDIMQNGLTDPNIRVSLYKKDSLTAFNQDYTIVDLAAYTSDELSLVSQNVYYAAESPVEYNEETKEYNNFVVNLNTVSFENTGYKFEFMLYDGDELIGTIEKRIIAR